jgi:hypothetical protein
VSRSVVRALLLIALTGMLMGAGPGAGSAGMPLGTRPVAEPVAGQRPAGPIVLLGTGGLNWDDVSDATPALDALLEHDAVAALAVRSVRDLTCPVDGWLAVSAGRRAADAALTGGAPCREPQAQAGAEGGPGQVAGWDTYRAGAAAGSFGADPGLLGSTLAAAGRSVAAVGPGAAIATADRQGRTARVWPGLPTGPQGTLDPGGDGLGLSRQVTAALASGADLVTVDLGAIRDVPDATAAGAGPPSRQEQVSALDTRLGLLVGALPAEATVIFASLADDGIRSHFQVVTAHAPGGEAGPGLPPGLLRSSSTRQDGLVQSTDLMPTVLRRLGVAIPVTAAGSPLTPVPGGTAVDRLQRVAELDQVSVELERLVTPFFLISGVIEALIMVALGLAAHTSRLVPPARHRALALLRAAAVTISLVPAATFLANVWPWWRGPFPGAALGTAVVVAVLPLGVLAHAGPWRRHPLGPAGAAGAITVAVLTLDVATGSRLSLAALIGGQPLLAGRFYGLSNPTFGIFATSAILTTVAVADLLRRRGRSPRERALAVLAAGLAVTVIDAAPGLGADFGGPPAIVPAFGLLALWVAGARVTWRRLALIVAATVTALALVSVLDWLRPATDRTHLGRFVATVLDGGAGHVVMRKLEQNLGLLVSSPLTLLVPPAAVAAVLVLSRPGRWYAPALEIAYRHQPLLRTGVATVGVLAGIGFAVNDSGTAIPPASFLVLAPALIAITAHAVDQDESERREAVAAAAPRRAPSGRSPRSRRGSVPGPGSGVSPG